MFEIIKEPKGVVRIFKGDEAATLRLKSTKGHSQYEGIGFLHERDYRSSPKDLQGRSLKFNPNTIQNQVNTEGWYPDFTDDVTDIALKIFETDAFTSPGNIIRTQRRKLMIQSGLSLRTERKELENNIRDSFSSMLEMMYEIRNLLVNQLSLLKGILLKQGIKIESLLSALENSQTKEEFLKKLHEFGIENEHREGFLLLLGFIKGFSNGILSSYWKEFMKQVEECDINTINKKLNELIDELERKIVSAKLRFQIDEVLVGSVDFSYNLHLTKTGKASYAVQNISSRGHIKNDIDRWNISYTLDE